MEPSRGGRIQPTHTFCDLRLASPGPAVRLTAVSGELTAMHTSRSTRELKSIPAGANRSSRPGNHSSRRFPDFQGFNEIHHSPPVLVRPSESRDRQQLLLIQKKQTFNDGELYDFGGNEYDGAREEMPGPQQIGAEGFCRLQQDHRYGKKRERRVGTERRDPASNPLQYFHFAGVDGTGRP